METFIHENVMIGNSPTLGKMVTIGLPFANHESGDIRTTLGDHANIRSQTIIYAGNKIGHHFTTGHMVVLREHNEIGNHVSVGTHTVIEHRVKLGDKVRVHSQAFIPEFTVVEYGAWVGPRVCVTNAKYPASKNAKDYLEGVHIQRKARIGANVSILPGLIVGEQCLIGSGSVVTKDIPAFAVAIGNPAVIVGDVRELKYPGDNAILPYDVDEE